MFVLLLVCVVLWFFVVFFLAVGWMPKNHSEEEGMGTAIVAVPTVAIGIARGPVQKT